MSQANIFKAVAGALPNVSQIGVKFVDADGTYAAWYSIHKPREGESGEVIVTVLSPERIK